MSAARPGGHKYARIEYERRFLLSELPAQIDPETGFKRIIDVYIDGTRLRRRSMYSPAGELLTSKFTQKYTALGQPPTETTITNLYLNETEAAMIESLPGLTLTKRRYPYPSNGVTYSLDTFEGPLAGLVLAEVEALSAEQIDSMPIPTLALREVTAEPAFTGGVLVRLSRSEFERLLSRELSDA